MTVMAMVMGSGSSMTRSYCNYYSCCSPSTGHSARYMQGNLLRRPLCGLLLVPCI